MTAVADPSATAPAARRPRGGLDWRLVAPLGLAYLVFFVSPLLLLVWISLQNDIDMTRFGLDQWARFLGDEFYRGVLVGTLRLGVLTVIATTVLSYPLALVFLAAPAGVRRLILFVILLPLLTSVVVRTFAWIVILSREGVINQTLLALGLSATPVSLLQTEFGLILALTQIEMPLMLLPLLAVMRGLDPSIVEASRALGASRFYTFFRVIVPLSAPGWIAGATLVFASATTAFVSHSVIGGARLVYLPAMIWQQAMVLYDWPFASVAAVALLLTVTAGILALGALSRLVNIR
jgi:putative spermidine/putrescine transport system permease protein